MLLGDAPSSETPEGSSSAPAQKKVPLFTILFYAIGIPCTTIMFIGLGVLWYSEWYGAKHGKRRKMSRAART